MVSRVLYRERFDNLTLCLKMFEDNIYRFRARVWDLFGLPLMSVEDVEDVEVQRPKLDPSCFGKRHTCCCWLFVNLISHL